jgi:hypothetical protein
MFKVAGMYVISLHTARDYYPHLPRMMNDFLLFAIYYLFVFLLWLSLKSECAEK